MLPINRTCLRLFVVTISVLCLIHCKSANQNESSPYDTTNLMDTDSTMQDTLGKDTSDISFGMVVDSVYQYIPSRVFAALLHGNDRYMKDSAFVYTSETTIPDSLSRLKPYLLLTDIDLPQSAEKIFDLRRSMFMQLSGPACLVDAKQIAVMEYAVQYSGTKVILILSSSNSRMIGAACDHVQTGNFQSISQQLSQAMNAAQEFADRSSANKDFVNTIARTQAGFTRDRILQGSPQIKMLADSGKVIVKSAFYDTAKRSVTILDLEAPLNPSTKK